MKEVILGLLVLITLGCEMSALTEDMRVYTLLEPVEFYDFAEYDLSNIHSFTDIGYFLQRNISYRADVKEHFSSPENTIYRGYGDCEDYVLAFMNIAYIVFGIELEFLVVDSTNRTVVNGGYGDHIILGYHGKTYSGQWGHELDYTNILYKYTFKEIFR